MATAATRPDAATDICVCGHRRDQHDADGVCQQQFLDMVPGRVYSGVEVDNWTGPLLACADLDTEDACPGFTLAPPCEDCGYDGGEGCVCGE